MNENERKPVRDRLYTECSHMHTHFRVSGATIRSLPGKWLKSRPINMKDDFFNLNYQS